MFCIILCYLKNKELIKESKQFTKEASYIW